MVFEAYAYLRVFFGAVKLMKFQSPFTLGFPYDIAYLVFFKSSQVFAKHGFASVFSIQLDIEFVTLARVYAKTGFACM